MDIKLRWITLLALVLVFQITWGQEKTISGVVSDGSGVPLPGVNITVSGTNIGTQTDFDGKYTINAASGAVLKFSFVGFEEQTATVGENNTLDISMQEGSALDEVIVTAFGRRMTRNESTSSVSVVSSEELTKSSTPDARDALQGQVTGLVMNATTGVPGAEPEIRIRGINSITAGNDPLYVIDGVPVNSSSLYGGSGGSTMGVFALINSSDIESISVLKDASAVAPYGADGANGVILITTKSGRGTAGKMQYNFNSSMGIQNDARPIAPVLNAQEHYDALAEAVWNSFGNEPWGSGVIQSRDQIRSHMETISQLRPSLTYWEESGKPDHNWQELVRNKNALLANVNFSAAKSDEESHLYASLGFNKTEGTVIGSGLQRWAGSINYGASFSDRLSFNVSARVANALQDYLNEEAVYFVDPLSARYSLIPWLSPYHPDGTYDLDHFNSTYSGSIYNVLFTNENNIFTRNVTRGIQNTNLEYKITDHLSFKTVFGMDFILNSYKKYDNPLHGDGADSFGRDAEAIQRLFNYTTQNSLDYDFKIADNHNFRVTGLYEYTKYRDKLISAESTGFPNDRLHNLSASSQINSLPTSTYSDQAKMRYVGLLNYNFNLKYLLDATYSYQGDSRFSDKWDSFYSIGAAWNIDKENFLQNVDFINTLRLKAGYGLTGNANIARNQFQQLVGYTVYNDNTAATLATYGTDATWERSKRFDIGTEFSLFDRRLEGGIGFYHNETTDMLLEVPLPESSGYPGGVRLTNAGNMTNEGIEVSLRWDAIKTADFTWHIAGNFSTLSNKVTRIPEEAEVRADNHIIEQGHRINEWYMVEWAGVDSDNGLPLYYKDRTVDNSTTSTFSEAKRNYIGKNPIPTYNGSISTRLDYKKFFLEGTLYFAGGNKIYEVRPDRLYTTNGSLIVGRNPLRTVYENAWRQPGDEAKYPRFDYNNSQVASAANMSNFTTLYLHDGDFMRLKDLGFGYTFEQDFIKDLGLQKVGLSIRGTNIWTWVKDNDLHLDPEVRTDGLARFHVAPPTKSILFNLNVTF